MTVYTPYPAAAVDLRLEKMLVGASDVMTRLKQAITLVGPSPVPVLVNGPTGSGKELVAHALHMLSGRTGDMVAVNCGAIPPDLIDSELFGHEKGAFTGANTQRIGLIEQAQGGTLFLDEIGEMPAAVQVKLLRALETRTIRRVGGSTLVKVDFRLVSASHRCLHEETAQGRFREDLLFRIEVFALAVPALTARTGDIPAILRAMADAAGAHSLQLAPDAIDMLGMHPWHGNVRELRNFHDRAQVLFRNRTITAAHVAMALSPSAGTDVPDAQAQATAEAAETGTADIRSMMKDDRTLDMRAMMQRVEARMISCALELTGGCTTKAARKLGLKRTTLIGRMQKLGVTAKAA